MAKCVSLGTAILPSPWVLGMTLNCLGCDVLLMFVWLQARATKRHRAAPVVRGLGGVVLDLFPLAPHHLDLFSAYPRSVGHSVFFV